MSDDTENTRGQIDADLNSKSASKVQVVKWVFPKTDERFWLQPGKLFKWQGSANYSLQVQFKGRRMAFTTRTGNKNTAAKKAVKIYEELCADGIEATLKNHRAKKDEGDSVATVGQWIESARKVSVANASTFNCYSCSLRKIIGDILAVTRTKKRFGPRKGGATAYRAAIDATSLEELTLPAIQKWRIAYVAQAKNPAQERSRMTSCNSTIRQARSLFAAKVLKFLPELRLPTPPPFLSVEFFPKQSAKYFSRIDPKALLQAAHSELAVTDGAAFLAMLLALSAGLRRGEIDSLAWHQVDFDRELIRIESTETASLKTRDSRDEVPIDSNVVSLLRGFRAKTTGAFVIEAEGEGSGPRKWGHHYRADVVFDRLTAWLRAHGVNARKPLHELRKELGALVTAEHGIYAASRVLRHSNVATTAGHYSDLKSRPVVNVGAWLLPENAIPLPLPEEAIQPKAIKKQATVLVGKGKRGIF